MNRKQLIKSNCANYKDGLCLIRDIECPLVIPFEYRGNKFPCEEAECSYFDKYVLGNVNEAKEENVAKRFSYKKCSNCGETFLPKSNASKFCSTVCRDIAKKKSHRKYNAKRT